MKYRPNYPGTFTDLPAARAYMDWYVPWYNQHHKHSGIALFSPNQVHDGTWRALWKQRDHAQQAYYNAHPEKSPPPPEDPDARQPRRHQPAQTRRRKSQRTTPSSLTTPVSREFASQKTEADRREGSGSNADRQADRRARGARDVRAGRAGRCRGDARPPPTP
jgi:hypothetical protein